MSETFQPDLRFAETSDGVQLRATTSTPSRCFSAGEANVVEPGEIGETLGGGTAATLAESGALGDGSGLPAPAAETAFVTLDIENTDGFCAQVVTPVDHAVSLPAGTEFVVAVAVLEGTPVGTTVERVPEDPPTAGGGLLDLSDLRATLDGDTLSVSATAVVEDSGVSAELVAGEADDPSVFGTTLQTTEGDGVVAPVVQRLSVSFQTTVDDPAALDAVSVDLPGGGTRRATVR